MMNILQEGTCTGLLHPISCTTNEYCQSITNNVQSLCLFHPLLPTVAVKKISSFYFTPLVFQFLGIFSIAGAMKKTNLDQYLASFMLRSRENPFLFFFSLLSFLFLFFFSFFFSNSSNISTPIKKTA